VVAEAAHRLRLAPHPHESVGIEAIRLDQGEGNVAVELAIVCEVDALLRTLAKERAHDVAAARERGGHRRCRRRLRSSGHR
jgi:hypothetical protein